MTGFIVTNSQDHTIELRMVEPYDASVLVIVSDGSFSKAEIEISTIKDVDFLIDQLTTVKGVMQRNEAHARAMQGRANQEAASA